LSDTVAQFRLSGSTRHSAAPRRTATMQVVTHKPAALPVAKAVTSSQQSDNEWNEF
jgi:hypothetical protein